jgi:hypothetical protein
VIARDARPNRVLANQIGGHKAERRPGAGEEWLAVTKHDRAEVESILINKTKVGQASWASLQPSHHRLDVILDKWGVGAD